MSHACKVLVSIRDAKAGYTNLLVYDTLDAAKRDFEAQLERFREKDRDDFWLCYYGMFDTDDGCLIIPNDDGNDQHAIYSYTALKYKDIPEFAYTPVKRISKGVELEYLYPTDIDVECDDLIVFPHSSKDKVDDKSC